MVSGDTCVLEKGVYDDVQILIDVEGEPGRPITIRAETPGDVVLRGRSSLMVSGSHVTIEGLSFKACTLEESCIVLDGSADCRAADCRFTESGGKKAAISIQGSACRNTVENCEFSHLEQRSIQVIIRGEEAPIDNRIVGNCFRDIPPIPSGNGRETIQIGQNQRDWGHVEPRTMVDQNRFLRCDGEIEIISNKSSRNSYRSNLFRDCKGELVMRGGSFCEIHGNRHENCSGGIRLSGTHHTVTHNLIRNCPNGFRVPFGITIEQGGLYQAVTGCLVAHNTVIDSDKVGINIGTNRGMDRKEMGVAKHAPYGNRFVYNVFDSDSGRHLVIDSAPDNEVVHNLFAGPAGVADEMSEVNVIAAESGLDAEGRPSAGSPAFDGEKGGRGAKPYSYLGVGEGELADTPTS